MSIVLKSLGYAHPDRVTLFNDIDLSIPAGCKAGLVGNNGSGKSTMMRLIAGLLESKSGEVVTGKGGYYVPQHFGQYDHRSVAEGLGVQDKLRALQAILSGKTEEEHFEVLEDDWEIEEKIKAALESWGLGHLETGMPLSRLSGGEKSRLFLAGAALHDPDVLLLDEPSNHLDEEGRKQLYAMIGRFRGTLLMVSHDRELLNLADVTLELSPHGIEVFGGNYDFYQSARAIASDALKAQLEEKEKVFRLARQRAREMAEQRQRMESRGSKKGKEGGMPRILAGGLKAKAEQSSARLNEIQDQKLNGVRDELSALRIKVRESQPLKAMLEASDLHHGKILVKGEQVQVAFGNKPLWETPIDFRLLSGERVRVEGKNGVGKTTLLKLMTGIVQPSDGNLYRSSFHSISIDQEYALIENHLTVFEQMLKFNTGLLAEHELKMLLHQHQFSQDKWNKPCAELSGGERMKLLLCGLAAGKEAPDLLILDEPTNHLDLQSQEILTAVVRTFRGAVLVISHDSHFIREIGVERSIRLS